MKQIRLQRPLLLIALLGLVPSIGLALGARRTTVPARTGGSPPVSAAGWRACSCGQPIADPLDGQSAYCGGGSNQTCTQTAYGYGYQCVELVNRYLQVVKHRAHIYANAGAQFCDTASRTPGYAVWGPRYGNPHGRKPSTGDVLVWNTNHGTGTGYPGRDAGHVAIVTRSDAQNIYYLQQNWGLYIHGRWSQLGNSSTPWDGRTSFFGGPRPEATGLHTPVCWVHAR